MTRVKRKNRFLVSAQLDGSFPLQVHVVIAPVAVDVLERLLTVEFGGGVGLEVCPHPSLNVVVPAVGTNHLPETGPPLGLVSDDLDAEPGVDDEEEFLEPMEDEESEESAGACPSRVARSPFGANP